MKRILGHLRRAAEDFNMIVPGDKIAVGVSGGKDSMLLLYALWLYKKFIKIDYEIIGITVDLGFEGFDTDSIAAFAENLGIEYHIQKTDIGKIIFDIRNESNPCSLCAKMRKGAFYQAAKDHGCNKAAFAHSSDDLIETLLLSILYEGKISVFSPVTHLSRQDITLIRPFLYLPEKEIISAVKRLDIPVSKNPCPADGITKRQDVKELMKTLTSMNPHVKKNILAAIRNTDQYNLWDKLSE
ncbi:MAG: tRNA 2-thiocytidine(32) synthetase TtcA [Christensenellaceae bacterium]|nr:tRNA 2-thiocytidine(32) synthetase TtcA [Christensenellaceae bacterium]